MCASAVFMVSIHPHSRCKLKRPGVPLYAVCCNAVCCFCKGFRPPLVDAVQGELGRAPTTSSPLSHTQHPGECAPTHSLLYNQDSYIGFKV